MFKLQYMDKGIACLAQSPQLYKQMGVCCDLQKVFEVTTTQPRPLRRSSCIAGPALFTQSLANAVPRRAALSHHRRCLPQVAPVFRAEKAHTNRHLTEYTGM